MVQSKTIVLSFLFLVVRGLGAEDAPSVERNLPFLEAGRVETLDLYLPAKNPANAQKSPGFVWIHGGGWTGGTKSENRAKEICSTMAKAGFVAISIDYKLGNRSWPQNLWDCKNAVRYLRVHAKKYDIDPERIVVAGGSAGGHLALMVAYTDGNKELEPTAPYPGISSRVGCVINMYGITNILTRKTTDSKGNPTGTAKLGTALSVFGAKSEDDPILIAASPVKQIRPGLPPTLILHGKADSTVDYLQAEELARELKKAGVTQELHLLEGVGHTFAFQTLGKTKLKQDLTPIVLNFLDKHLK